MYICIYIHQAHDSATIQRSLCPAAIGPQAIVQGEAAEGQDEP